MRTARTFSIATGSADVFPVVVALLEHDGHVGIGEASPSKRVTGETVDTVGQFLDWAAADLLKDAKPAGWEKLLDHMHGDTAASAASEAAAGRPWASGGVCGNPSARCAVDLAMHDLVGKMGGVPARSLYGLPAARIETSMTVPLDSPREMAALALDYRARGFRCLKLKLGDADEDVARVEAVRRAVPDARLRADANTGWTEAEAREVLPELLPLGVEFVEQPVHPEQKRSLVELSKWSPIPIYADESVLDVHDVERLATAGFSGGVNLKLQKTGGLRPAIGAARKARAKGYWVQLGCNIETSVSISGALQMLALLDHADLDGNLLLADDPYATVEPDEGWYATSDAPGLGVAPRP